MSAEVSLFSEFIAKSIFLYIQSIFFHSPFLFADTYSASAVLSVIIILHVSNWIFIWCSISLVCAELGLVDGDGCVWGFRDCVTFFSNVPIRFCLSSGTIVLRLNPSTIDFSSICLTSPCSGNTFGQYRIWAPKDDSRDISWVSSFLSPSSTFCVIGFASALSATYFPVCSPACCSWGSVDIVSCASVRVAIAACIDSKFFSAFTQDTAISLDVDEIYSTVFFGKNGGTGE